MATRVLVDDELARLREFPEITREELFRFFTLTQAELQSRRNWQSLLPTWMRRRQSLQTPR